MDIFKMATFRRTFVFGFGSVLTALVVKAGPVDLSSVAQQAPDFLAEVPTYEFLNRTPNCNRDPKGAFSARLEDKRDMRSLVNAIDDDTVLVIGDGGHGSPDIRHLFIAVAQDIAARNIKARHYVEVRTQHPGLGSLSEAYVEKITFDKGSSGDAASTFLYVRYLARLNDTKRASVMAADNGEGIPIWDGGIAYMSEESQDRYNIFWDAFLKNGQKAIFDRTKTKKLIEAALAKQKLTATEKVVFTKSASLLIDYASQRGWEEDLGVNTAVRLEKDPLLAKRIADDIKANPKAPVIITYGLGHVRHGSNGLVAQLQKLLPHKRIQRLMVYGDQQMLRTYECQNGHTPNGAEMVLLRPGQIPAPTPKSLGL